MKGFPKAWRPVARALLQSWNRTSRTFSVVCRLPNWGPVEHDGSWSGVVYPWRFLVKRALALLTVILAFSAIAAKAADTTTINGYISDAMCGAKHAGSGA